MDLEILLTNKHGQPMLGYDAENNAVVLIPGLQTGTGAGGGDGLPEPPVLVETGPWTPALYGTAGASDQAYSQQSGFYVRLGPLVWISGTVHLTAAGVITGGVLLGGLPVDVGPGGGAIAVPVFTGLVGHASVDGLPVPSSDKVALFGAAPGNSVPIVQADLTDDLLLTFSGWYAAA